jgi:hypothetical protein
LQLPLLYLTAPSRGRQGVGIGIEGRSRLAGEPALTARLEQVRAQLAATGPLGTTPVELGDEAARRAAAAFLVVRAKAAVEVLQGAFHE